jgi:hypothetical protein
MQGRWAKWHPSTRTTDEIPAKTLGNRQIAASSVAFYARCCAFDTQSNSAIAASSASNFPAECDKNRR